MFHDETFISQDEIIRYQILKTFDFMFKSDDNKGYRGIEVKALTLITFLTSILLAFQNCGQSQRNTIIFDEETLESNSCDSFACQGSANLLWLRIREYDPYKVPIQRLGGHFTVGGQCGVGTYGEHSFKWILEKGFGDQEIIAEGSIDNLCDLGQFQIPVIFDENNLPEEDVRYQLHVEIVGVDSSGVEYSNPLPASKASIDVIFTRSFP